MRNALRITEIRDHDAASEIDAMILNLSMYSVSPNKMMHSRDNPISSKSSSLSELCEKSMDDADDPVLLDDSDDISSSSSESSSP